MPTFIRWIPILSGAAWILVGPRPSTAQAPYYGAVRMARGQDVTPAFEGWMANANGTFTLYFGYMNRNYEEELDIPVGPDNNIEPGGDRGQPTHFYARRQRLVFSIVVPKDWGPERKVVWTLSIRGRTNVAKGWLQPEWEIDKEVIMQNAAGAADLQNEPPVITGSGPQDITLPNDVTLTATAQDDGRPGPRRLRDVEGGNDLSAGRSVRPLDLLPGSGPGEFHSGNCSDGVSKAGYVNDEGVLPGAGRVRGAGNCQRWLAFDVPRCHGHGEVTCRRLQSVLESTVQRRARAMESSPEIVEPRGVEFFWIAHDARFLKIDLLTWNDLCDWRRASMRGRGFQAVFHRRQDRRRHLETGWRVEGLSQAHL